MHLSIAPFSPFRSDGNAVAAEWGRNFGLGVCSNKRKHPADEPVALQQTSQALNRELFLPKSSVDW
jgi:hypothetical protein